ncbi:MAG TPA: hypothetical protein VEC12_10890, partial [Bacteroidia bacterium]|nr:hypothetical protein [Bacteroidia bacterium]
MMKRFKPVYTLFLTALLLFISQSVFGQKSFGREPEKFIKELESFMNKNEYPKAQLAFADFKIKFDAKRIPDNELQRIIITCNEMLDKKMKPSPDFESFLKTVTGFINAGKMESHYM